MLGWPTRVGRWPGGTRRRMWRRRRRRGTRSAGSGEESSFHRGIDPVDATADARFRGELVEPSRRRRGERLKAVAVVGVGDCRIKGNISRKGTRICYVPRGASYAKTRIDGGSPPGHLAVPDKLEGVETGVGVAFESARSPRQIDQHPVQDGSSRAITPRRA